MKFLKRWRGNKWYKLKKRWTGRYRMEGPWLNRQDNSVTLYVRCLLSQCGICMWKKTPTFALLRPIICLLSGWWGICATLLQSPPVRSPQTRSWIFAVGPICQMVIIGGVSLQNKLRKRDSWWKEANSFNQFSSLISLKWYIKATILVGVTEYLLKKPFINKELHTIVIILFLI